MRTGQLNGVKYDLSAEENAVADAQEAQELLDRAMNLWEGEITASDAVGISRDLENVIDSIDAAQLSRLDSTTKAKYLAKKEIRDRKPT